MNGITDRSILSPYLKNGSVDYRKLKTDPSIPTLVNYIETADISKFSLKEQFAFWLNAYNIITLKSVLNRLEQNNSWKGNLSLWSKVKFFVLEKHLVAGQKITLYNLENKILRKRFKDPRIHFAINCASVSCPVLPGKLFMADDLDDTLYELTVQFINSENVRVDGETLYVSKIFSMYKKDFSPSIREFIMKYHQDDLSPIRNIKFMKYNWKINSQFT